MHPAVVRVGVLRLVIHGGEGIQAKARPILPLEGAAVVQQILVDAAQIRAAQALANASQSFPGRGGGRAQGGRGRDREDTQAGDAAFQVANTDTAVPADRSQ